MEKKIYQCDYCGKECNPTPDYVLPELDYTTSYAIKNGSKIAAFTMLATKPKQVDICSTCSDRIARMANLLRYADINIVDAWEKTIYDAFMGIKDE